MKNKDRFTAVLNGEKPSDRLPIIEWAGWWHLTIENWKSQGAQFDGMTPNQIRLLFGLDELHQLWVNPRSKINFVKNDDGSLIQNEQDYESIRSALFDYSRIPEHISWFIELKDGHSRGDIAVWYTLEGFFWFPRTILGIENHLYAFYDTPALMHKINRDLTDYHKAFLSELYRHMSPDFMTFAEDMSYNHGPMCSKDHYDEFMKPYYLELIDFIKGNGTKVFIDTDGQVEPLIPWFMEAGIEGVLPLERMAGVDVNRIREHYPKWLMIGGFDKTVMHRGQAAIRNEFERIFPAACSMGYIPSVDHQTPPDVDLDTYRIYVDLLKEYATKAVQ